MRPLKLEMCAFGPYKDKVCIDFECLGEQGIYLITGATGSGKTTVFDAISFALFGVASGSRRENSSFRSDFVDDAVQTYVKLEFFHKDVCYQVKRVPRYFRKKLRGEGKTIVGGEATLCFLDLVVTGDKNVTMKCIDILGMNALQFKQISMIAQGEFLDLLFSDSKSRANIFRHIFDTGIYKKISEELKSQYLEKKREYEDDKLLFSQLVNSILWEKDEKEEKSTSEVLRLLEEENARDKEREDLLEKEKLEISKSSEKLVQDIREGIILNQNIQSLENLKEELEKLKKEELLILDRKGLLEKNHFIWDLVVPKHQEILRLKQEKKEKQQLLVEKRAEFQEKCDLFEKVLEQFEGIQKMEEKVSFFKEEKLKWQEKFEILRKSQELKKKMEELRDKLCEVILLEKMNLLEKFQTLHEGEQELLLAKEKFLKEKELYEKKRQVYLESYDLFLGAQAGILAENLKENCPCPVCGSLIHPRKACIRDEVVSKVELDEMRDIVDNMQKKLENSSLEIQKLENAWSQLQEELKGYQESSLLDEMESLNQQGVILKEKKVYSDVDKKELELELHGLERTNEEYLKKLEEGDTWDFVSDQLVSLQVQISNLERDVLEIRDRYTSGLQEKARLESLIQVLENDVKDLDERVQLSQKEYEKAYRDLGYEKESLYLEVKLEKDLMSEYEKSVKDYYEKFQNLNSQISILKELVQGKTFIDLSRLEREKNVLDEKLGCLELSLKEINHKLSNNIKCYDEIKTVYEKSTKFEQEVMLYKDLSDTANGMIVGRNKLEFEQFVQAYYFDLVLRDANKRFLSMTEDRYQLVRKEEALKVSDKLGLELEVMDYYTGKKRDIRSLSGGESFKAALSLALGMSDTIQAFAGGVVVDAMFIDEGFGSLDEESLDQAMNAIENLSQGNRMIGIISHVSELKSRIEKKIVIDKSSNGSSVHIVV